MSGAILLSATPLGRRAAVLEGARVGAFLLESAWRPSRAGDVHLGRVVRPMAQLSGAFVALGEGVDDGWLETTRRLAPGEAVVVQIASDARGRKGPRLSLAVGLAGRALVLQPARKSSALSRRIQDEAAARRLGALLASLDAASGGFVARRAAGALPDEALRDEAARLVATWRAIEVERATGGAPRRLWSAGALAGRLLRDHLAANGRLLVDDRATLESLRALARERFPALEERIELAEREPDLFERHDVHGALEAARSPLAPFEGGRLVIEATEALTAIDVDVAAGSLAQAARPAMMAVGRAVLQRNLAGLIVLDAPRLRSARAREAMVAALQAALDRDRASHHVHGLTPAGLIELTRQRLGENVEEALSEAAGPGEARTPRLDALGFDLLVAARRAVHAGARRLAVRAAPALFDAIERAPGLAGDGLARWLGRPLERRPEPARAPGRFEIESL